MIIDARGNLHWPPGDRRGGRFAPKQAHEPARPAPPAPRQQPKPARPVSEDTRAVQRIQRRLRAVDEEDLARAHRELAAAPASAGRDLAVRALRNELRRRERAAAKAAADPRAAAVDELVRAGESFAEAYAQVHNLSAEQMAAQERAALLDAQRRPGETRRKAIRRLYDEHIAAAYLDAEAATRANLLSPAGRARKIDPQSLFSGPSDRARRYASKELKLWWEEHGGRPTFPAFQALYAGTAARRNAARASAQRAAGRDYGV